MLSLYLLACTSSAPPAVPSPTPAAAPEPAAASEPAPAPEATAPAVAPPPQPASLSGTPLDGWYSSHIAESDAITAGIASAQSDDELLAVWKRALVFTEPLSEPLSGFGEETEYGFELHVPDDIVKALAARAPWMFLTYYAEGTVAAMELGPPSGEKKDDRWLAAAARTSGDADDVLFELVYAAYAQASPRGWATWQRRDWDYGGCSPMGEGAQLHLTLLKLTDTLAANTQVADTVARIRTSVLNDILQPQGPGEFPYCVLEVSEDASGLIAEATAILAEVNLTAAEKAAVQARIDAGFPQTIQQP